MTVGFTTTYNGRIIEVDDLLVKREFFNDGTLWTWGEGTSGKLGTGGTTNRSSPGTTAGGDLFWKTAAINYIYFGCGAIKSDGTLWTWGGNTYGQLGNGSTVSRSSPGTTAGGGNNWEQVSFGFHHTAGIKTDGTLWTWGYNAYGGLGTGTTTSRSSPGTTAGGGTNWKQVCCGYTSTAAVKYDGTLWTWGANAVGDLGTGNTNSRSSPGTTAGGGTDWKQVAVGTADTAAVRNNTMAAIKTDGTLWMWGRNADGVLGDNTTSNRSSPVTTVGGGTNWKQVAVNRHTAAAVKTDGTLWTWGYGGNGQLGDGGSGASNVRSSPGTTVVGGTTWKQVSCGYTLVSAAHLSAVKTDGTLWSWGIGGAGQVGDGSSLNRVSPVQVAGGGTNWKQSVAGGAFTVAITDLTI